MTDNVSDIISMLPSELVIKIICFNLNAVNERMFDATARAVSKGFLTLFNDALGINYKVNNELEANQTVEITYLINAKNKDIILSKFLLKNQNQEKIKKIFLKLESSLDKNDLFGLLVKQYYLNKISAMIIFHKKFIQNPWLARNQENLTRFPLDVVMTKENKNYFLGLNYLNLGGNQLRFLPELLGKKLINLETLDLSNNILNNLPDSLSGLKKLRKLHLQDNQFETCPTVIEKMESISYICLDGNRLTFLPSNFKEEMLIDRLHGKKSIEFVLASQKKEGEELLTEQIRRLSIEGRYEGLAKRVRRNTNS